MSDRCLLRDRLYEMRTLPLSESREKECFVLLIEEQAELRELHMVALELEGYRPIAVPRGSDALNWLCMVLPSGIAPVAIILDHMVLRGNEAGGYIRQRLKDLFTDWEISLPPLILITPHGRHPDPDVLGVQDILSQPFPLKRLTGAINRLS